MVNKAELQSRLVAAEMDPARVAATLGLKASTVVYYASKYGISLRQRPSVAKKIEGKKNQEPLEIDWSRAPIALRYGMPWQRPTLRKGEQKCL